MKVPHKVKLDMQCHYIGKGTFYDSFWGIYNTGDYEALLDHMENSPMEDESLLLVQLHDNYVIDVKDIGVKEAMTKFKMGVDTLIKQWKQIDESYKLAHNAIDKDAHKTTITLNLKPKIVNRVIAIITMFGGTITFTAILSYKDELGSWSQLLMLLTQLISIAYVVRTWRLIGEPTELQKLNQENEILKMQIEQAELKDKLRIANLIVEQKKINEGF